MSLPGKADLPAIPYPGIEPFTYAEREVFFARAVEARRLIRLITLYRGVLLYAASGVGKSSLVNAGVIPLAIEEGHRPERLRVQIEMNREIVAEGIPGRPSLFIAGGERTVLPVESFLKTVRSQAREARPLLIFDQFEEWVTLSADVPAERRNEARKCRQRILDALVFLLNDPQLTVKILIVLREDYLANLQPLFEHCPTLPDHYLRPDALTSDQLQRAIRGPFERFPEAYAPKIEPSLAAEIIRQLTARAGSDGTSLTELQIICRSLFEAGLDNQEPARVFTEAGGVQGMLERFLEGALDSLGPKLRDPARALLGRLLTSAGTRNVINRDDLLERVAAEDEIPQERLAEALDGLETKTRLIRKELRREVYFYEIVSEFLVDWIRQQTARRRLAQVQRTNRRLLRFAAALGVGLLVVAGLALFAWIQWQEAERQKQLRISHFLAEESGDALVESVPLALLLASESVRRAQLAQSGSLGRAEESLRRALNASPGHVIGTDGTPVFAAAMSPDGRWVAAAGQEGVVYLWRLGSAGLESQQVHLTGYRGRLAAVAVGPGGRTLAIVGEGSSVFLWDLDGSIRSSPRLLTSEVNLDTALFSPDGRWLAAAGPDGVPQVWRVLGEAPAAATALRRPGCKPTKWSYSPRLHWISVGCDDGATVLWDLRGPELKRRDIPPLREEVSALAFDPDESRLAVGSLDGSVRLWRLDSSTPPELSVDLATGPAEVAAVAFHPGGEQLAAAFVRGDPKLWQVGRSRSPSLEPVQAAWDPRAGLAWSNDGRWLLVWNPEGRSQLWAPSAAGKLIFTRNVGEKVRAAAFSSNSRWLATGDIQGRLQRWDLRQLSPPPAALVPLRSGIAGRASRGASTPRAPVLHAHEGPVVSLRFGDGDWVLTRSTAGPSRLWELGAQDPARGDEPLLLPSLSQVPPDTDRSRALGPDGTWRLSIRGDQPVLQDGPNAGRSIVLRRHEDGVADWEWSADGRLLVTGAGDGTARLWDLERLRALADATVPPEPAGSFEHRAKVTLGVFSPDGRWLVTLGGDAALWPLDRPGDIMALPGHPGSVLTADISSSSQRLVTADEKGIARLWDLTRQLPGTSSVELPQQSRPIIQVRFDPRGKALFTTTDEGTRRRWRVRLDDLMDLACRTAGRNLTPQEWAQVLGDEEHRGTTCPDFEKN